MGKTKKLNNNDFLKIAGMEGLKSYKLIVELAQDAIFVKDLESHYILVNQKTLEAFGGLPREEVLGKDDYELLPPEQAKINIEDDQKVFKMGKPVKITKKMSAGGKEFYFQAIKTPLKDKKGKVIGLVGIAHDITECKQAEEALKLERERLFSALDSVNALVVIEDRDFNIQFENKALREAFGGNVGSKCYKSYIGRRIPCKVCPIKEILHGNKTEFTYYPEAGGRIFESHAAKFKNPDGSLSIIEVLIDITARRQAEEALKESESKLREQKLALEQKTIALREIVAQIEVEKNKIKDDVVANVNELLLPILTKLRIDGADYKYVDLIQYHLEELTSSFGRELTKKSLKLTPREIEICSMVKGGLTSKEVSNLLNISYSTVEKHRKNIRKKLGITKKDINLTSFLQTV